MTESSFSLKDHLFHRENVSKIAQDIKNVYPAFQQQEFIERVVKKFPELELKSRIDWIGQNFEHFLPKDYQEAVKILLAALPDECDPTLGDDDFGNFIYAPFSDFIAKHAESKKNLHFSLESLRQITTRCSAEDAIRYFINFNAKETLSTMLEWTNDSHYHVRRLGSEGSRPKLPWSQKISISVEETLPILDQLFSDHTRYVTRSVANHLNDISKTNPELVIETLKRWQASQKQHATEMQYITKHALRTLIKLGHPAAFSLLGFDSDAKVNVTKLELKKAQLAIGEPLEFEVGLAAEQNGPLLIDYTMYFPSKTAGKLNKKIYKLTTVQALKDHPLTIIKKHPLRPNMTTRKIYPGTHTLEVQVNGSKLSSTTFEILDKNNN